MRRFCMAAGVCTGKPMSTLRLHSLAAHEAARFEDLTFPAYRHLLDGKPQTRHRQGDDRVIRPFAIAAEREGLPAGLALADHAPGEREATLLSISVAPALRRKGIGSLLLQTIADVARSEGLDRLQATWMAGNAQTSAIEALLARCGFSAPLPRMLSLRFRAEVMAQAEWLRRYPLRPGYTVFSWADLDDADLRRLKQSQAERGWIAPDLQPWDHDRHGFEPATSVGLRYRGEVVGWVITHPIEPGTVRYTCSFVRADLARLGRILPLYGESFRRLQRFGFQRGVFTTPYQHAGMVNFARRWMAPHAEFVGETRGAERRLG